MTRAVGVHTEVSSMKDAVNYQRWVVDLIRPWARGKMVLEIGVGLGNYTEVLQAFAEKFTATDVDAECMQRFKGTASSKIRCVVADLCDANFQNVFAGERFEVVVCLNVLEHLSDDTAGIANLNRVLRPGGMLLLQVPAHRSCFGPMDTLAGHHRRYSISDVRRSFAGPEWNILECGYLNPVGAIGWFLNARLFRPGSLSDKGIGRRILLFDRYLVALSRLLTPATKHLFGQSVWARIEKTGL